jgi:hypothetical protein
MGCSNGTTECGGVILSKERESSQVYVKPHCLLSGSQNRPMAANTLKKSTHAAGAWPVLIQANKLTERAYCCTNVRTCLIAALLRFANRQNPGNCKMPAFDRSCFINAQSQKVLGNTKLSDSHSNQSVFDWRSAVKWSSHLIVGWGLNLVEFKYIEAPV